MLYVKMHFFNSFIVVFNMYALYSMPTAGILPVGVPYSTRGDWDVVVFSHRVCTSSQISLRSCPPILERSFYDLLLNFYY